MSLRTAPCPTCAGTIVFGERRCRSCGMTFDYGPNPPAEPTQAEIFDALLSAPEPAKAPASSGGSSTATTPPARPAAPTPPARPASSTPPSPAVASSSPASSGATLEGLDTGRFDVGEVSVDDIPGFIDSSLFASMTPDTVDVAPVAGLEVTHVEVGDVAEIKHLDVEGTFADVGEVVPSAAVPGLYGASMFKTDIDFAAGGDQSPMLDVTTLKVRPKAAKRATVADDDLGAIVCANCGLLHSKPRCPTCATPHPHAEAG